MSASVLVWVGFAAALAFVVAALVAAAVEVIFLFADNDHELVLDDLWDDGPEPAWLIRARYEIRDLPEVTA